MRDLKTTVAFYKYAFAIWADRADFITDKTAPLNEETLLELRCFDEDGEYRAFRDTLPGAFTEREIRKETEASYADGYYDEAQYLDIDERKTSGGLAFATGGGSYRLPDDARGKKMILVRHYYDFDEEGVARRSDWRLVKFTDAETTGRGNE